jgi:uncharacterized protein (UPF0332 family)
METKAQAYWDKSKENLRVWRWACRAGHFNAAASRYYYALRLAAQAFFETRGIDQPYAHAEFNAKLEEELAARGYGLYKIGPFLKDAMDLRHTADYNDVPVEDWELDEMKRNCAQIWKAMGRELKSGT